MLLTPLVRWYQDLNKIYITIEVSDAKVGKNYFAWLSSRTSAVTKPRIKSSLAVIYFLGDELPYLDQV